MSPEDAVDGVDARPRWRTRSSVERIAEGAATVDSQRFDGLAKVFAQRRLSRRTALWSGSAGLTAALIGEPGLNRQAAAAQDATPVATPTGKSGARAAFLFVQFFHSGTLLPKPGQDGVFELTLSGPHAETVYFSDRPERVVGTISTDRFLEALGFTPGNPPNAALATRTGGTEDIHILELSNPQLSRGFGDPPVTTLTYDVRLLDGYTGEGLAHLAQQQGNGPLAEQFGPTSLFIDDCPDKDFCCVNADNYLANYGIIGPMGTCWHASSLSCGECWDYGEVCNSTYPTKCHGNCTAFESNKIFCVG
jgi:hypothetical protein